MSNPMDADSSKNIDLAAAVDLTKKASTAEEKELRAALFRSVLPACQPQEGSPANTFTTSELQELQAALPNLQIGTKPEDAATGKQIDLSTVDCWEKPPSPHEETPLCASSAANCQDGSCDERSSSAAVVSTIPTSSSSGGNSSKQLDILGPWEPPTTTAATKKKLNWHGAPRFKTPNIHLPRDFRQMVRSGQFQGPTNAVCPGFLQCNLVVLPQGKLAFDFLLFCQRNPTPCPLIEVCEFSTCPEGVAPGADLRTDVPKYAIYRNGVLEKEVTDATPYWPENAVAFLIGCSFSYDGALMDAGIPLRSAEQGKNVPMYKTNLACRPAGSLHGNMVVSMKPIPALQISRHVEITSSYKHAHGGPVCVGHANAIGIADIDKPEWGDAIEVRPEEIPVFHACGVTPQSVLMDSKVPFCITHAAGHMFVTDLPADMVNL